MKIDENISTLTISMGELYSIKRYHLQRDSSKHLSKLITSLKKIYGSALNLIYDNNTVCYQQMRIINVVVFDKRIECFESGKNIIYEAHVPYIIDGCTRRFGWQTGKINAPNDVELHIERYNSIDESNIAYETYNNQSQVETMSDIISHFFVNKGYSPSSKIFSGGYGKLLGKRRLNKSISMEQTINLFYNGIVELDTLFLNKPGRGSIYNAQLKMACIIYATKELLNDGKLSNRFKEALIRLITDENDGKQGKEKCPLLVIKDLINAPSKTSNSTNDDPINTGIIVHAFEKYVNNEKIINNKLNTNISDYISELYDTFNL